MGCYFWGDDEWRECDDCPYSGECSDGDDNEEESEEILGKNLILPSFFRRTLKAY